MTERAMDWPADVDGDVLRALQDAGFDFSKPTLIDFNVDFRNWPPPQAALTELSRHHPSVEVIEPDEDHDGYLLFQVYALVTYELVMNIQNEVTERMTPFQGECSSWGVWGSSTE
jgi:Regulator of ribonuclease activity B